MRSLLSTVILDVDFSISSSCWWLPLLCKSFLSLIRYHLFIFISTTLRGGLQRILLWFMSKNVLPVFSSKSFIVSGLTWKSAQCRLLFSSVQFSHSVVSDSLWPHEPQASLSITNSRSLLKLMLIESVVPSSHLILSRPLLLLPPILPSIRVFPSESALRIRWPKDWSFSFSIGPFNEHSGLISFRMD